MEDVEIKARAASPEHVNTNTVVSALSQITRDMREDQVKRDKMVMEYLMAMTAGSTSSPPHPLPPPPPLPPPQAEAPPPDPPPPVVSGATAGARVKHKRKTQNDVAHFSSWCKMSDALEYAIFELAPREKGEGHTWRILKREDGREDRSRDKQWRCYRSLAIAVGILMREGQTPEEAASTLQSRFESVGSKHTPLLRAINEEIKKRHDADVIARDVLGF